MLIRETTANKIIAVLCQALHEAKIIAGEEIDLEMDIDICAEACQSVLEILGINEIAEGV